MPNVSSRAVFPSRPESDNPNGLSFSLLHFLYMKVVYEKVVMHSPLAVLRKAGYSPFTDPQSGERSFVLKLTSEFYPRFHLYVDEKNCEVTFSLHLDQKKPSYGANQMHGGEYEGPTIEKEMRRIKRKGNENTNLSQL